MPIELTCSCGVRLRTSEAAAGKLVKCPKCGSLLPVPKAAPEAEIPAAPLATPELKPAASAGDTKACPACGAVIQAAAIICRHCRHSFGGAVPGGRKCPECNSDNPRTSQLCQACGAALTRAAVGLGAGGPMGKRDLDMERHLRAIAIWYRINGVLLFVACACFIIAAVVGISQTSGRGRGGEAGIVAGVMMVMVVICGGIGLLTYLLGHYLAKYSNGARITTGVLAILGMVGSACNLLSSLAQLGGAGRAGAPEGAVLLGVLVMVVLWIAIYGGICWAVFNGRSAAICTEQYRALVARTPSQQPSTYSSVFFWGPFVMMALGCGLIAMMAAAGNAFR